ncbi:MAG: hypothetical protein OHK0029_02400 [Armatimonadaceae bacterium]
MSQGSTLNDTHLPVRWVVMFTGSKATEDYQPSASAAEPSALVQEVTDLCVAFHPHTDIRLFPQDGEAILFWKARTTEDWVVTRVGIAPNPKGLRTALEYCSVVFSDEVFQRIGRNPFRTREFKLHEKARQQFLEQEAEPLDVDLADLTAVVSVPPVPAQNGTGEAPLIEISENGSEGALEAEEEQANEADKPAGKPSGSSKVVLLELHEMGKATPANFRALKDYANRVEEKKQTPQTFATWWSSTGDVPDGYFDIVLRAVAPKPLNLREAIAEVKALNSYTKESLPNAPAGDAVAASLANSILSKADDLLSRLNSVAARSDMISVGEFQAELAEASGLANQISGDAENFRSRILTSIPRNESAKLDEVADRFGALGRELSKVPHPNPFSAGTPTAATPAAPASSGSISKTARPLSEPENPQKSGGVNPIGIVVGVLAVGAVAAAVFIPRDKGTEPASGTNSPTPVASVAATPETAPTTKPSPKAPPAAASVKEILTEKQELILNKAKGTAENEAQDEATKKGPLNSKRVDEITLAAIRAAFKEVLTADQFKKAFTGANAWRFAQLKENIPTLTLEVRAGAEAGAAAGATMYEANQKIEALERQKLAAEAAAQRAEQQRERERRAAERQSTPRPSSTPRPTPKKTETPKPPSKPSEGSAKSTGL